MPSLDPERLLRIIAFQSEVARTRMDLGEVITRTAERSQELLEADGAVVELAEGEDMVYRGVAGLAAMQLGMRIPRASSLSGRCVAEGAPLRCDDSERDPRVNAEACRRVGLRSMVVVPLRHEGATVGVLKVLSKAPDRFDEADQTTLGLLSEVIAAAMAHATEHGSRVAEAEALYAQATRDALTGLANRAHFFDQLRQGLALAGRQGQVLGVALLDMDGLKPLNDDHGHQAGDAALRTLAERLRRGTRASDTPARLGGDEYAVIFTSVPDAATAQEIGAKLARSVQGPFEFKGGTYPLGASMGLAVFPVDGRTPEELMEQADRRMYEAKRARNAARLR